MLIPVIQRLNDLSD